MLKVRAGELDALGLLFERYKKVLYSFFCHMTGDGATSEDLVQNVFYRVIRYRRKFKGSGSFKAWLFSIARNVLADEFRKKRVIAKEDIHHVAEKHSNEMSSSDRMAEQERNRLLISALNRLEDRKREILILVKLEEMKYREVAELLGMNESTVKVIVFRAMKELQSFYQGTEKWV